MTGTRRNTDSLQPRVRMFGLTMEETDGIPGRIKPSKHVWRKNTRIVCRTTSMIREADEDAFMNLQARALVVSRAP